MENVNQIKLVITKFNDKKIIISVYSKQNGRYLTRSGKMFELLDMSLYYPLNIVKNKVHKLMNIIAENNNEIVFNGKPQLHVVGVYYDKSLINRDIKLSGVIFKIKEKHVLKERDTLNIQIARDRDFTDLVFDREYDINDYLTSEELNTIFKQLNPTGISELLNEYKNVMSRAINTRQNMLPLGATKTEDLAEWAKEMGFNFKYEDPNVPETLKTSDDVYDGKHVLVLNEDYDMKFFNTYEDLLEFVKYTGIDLFKIGSKLNYEVKGLLSESYKMLLNNHNRPEKVKFYYAGNFVRNDKRKVVYKKIKEIK